MSAANSGYAVSALPATDLITLIEEFNRIFKHLACDLATKYPTDATIDRIKKRIILAVNINPISIIDIVGPYFFTYRTQVYSGDEKFFIENDYDTKLLPNIDAEKADLISYIIPKVKQAWRASSISERDDYVMTIQSLLDVYIEYLALKIEQQ